MKRSPGDSRICLMYHYLKNGFEYYDFRNCFKRSIKVTPNFYPLFLEMLLLKLSTFALLFVVVVKWAFNANKFCDLWRIIEYLLVS